MVLDCLAVGIGGFIGAVLRYLIGLHPALTQDAFMGFPAATFLINVVGSVLIGLIVGVCAANTPDPRLVVFLRVGICGGFTTLSTFSVEAMQLIQSGAWAMALIYMIATFALSLGCVFAGNAAGQAIAAGA